MLDRSVGEGGEGEASRSELWDAPSMSPELGVAAHEATHNPTNIGERQETSVVPCEEAHAVASSEACSLSPFSPPPSLHRSLPTSLPPSGLI